MSGRKHGDAEYEVGYGKPPQSTRFEKGRSGNPNGRPKGRKKRAPNKPGYHLKPLTYELSPESLKETFLEEAYRMVSINTGKGEEEIPIAQAVIRALGVKAAKGHIHAQRLFTKTLSDIEAQNRAQSQKYMDDMILYKQTWSAELERRERLGLPLDPPVPHPDDVLFDVRRGIVEVLGPLSTKEKADHENYAELLAENRDIRDRYEDSLQQPLACEAEASHREWIKGQLVQVEKLIYILEAMTGERDMPSPAQVRKLARSNVVMQRSLAE